MFKSSVIKNPVGIKAFSLTALVSIWMWTIPAQASSVIVENNGRVFADISASDVTRIAVANDRINLLRGTAGAYTVSNDTVRGAIFIKPVDHHSPDLKSCSIKNSQRKKYSGNHCQRIRKRNSPLKPFYIFISTEQDRQYVLWLTPHRYLHADMLIIKPHEIETAIAKSWENSETYSQTLIRLAASIIIEKTPPGYTRTVFKKPQDFSFGKALNVQWTESYDGAKLSARIYHIINHSRQTVILTGKEFYQPGDRAIYLQQATLSPGQSTQLIKVTSHA